jgi:hypothetical protein
MADIRASPLPQQHPSAVNKGPPHSSYKNKNYFPTHKSRLWGILRYTLFIVLCLGIIAAIVLIPLFMTGVLSLHPKKSETVAKRSTYDPFYYGNLHPYLFPGEKEDLGIETDYDVIVVGAGIAGLTVASELQLEGLNVLVLEARVRRF